MNRFTKQEQMVLLVVISLLLVGWAVKAYRMATETSSVVSSSASP